MNLLMYLSVNLGLWVLMLLSNLFFISKMVSEKNYIFGVIAITITLLGLVMVIILAKDYALDTIKAAQEVTQ